MLLLQPGLVAEGLSSPRPGAAAAPWRRAQVVDSPVLCPPLSLQGGDCLSPPCTPAPACPFLPAAPGENSACFGGTTCWGGPVCTFVNEALYVCLSLIRTNLHLVITTVPHLLTVIYSPGSVPLLCNSVYTVHGNNAYTCI